MARQGYNSPTVAEVKTVRSVIDAAKAHCNLNTTPAQLHRFYQGTFKPVVQTYFVDKNCLTDEVVTTEFQGHMTALYKNHVAGFTSWERTEENRQQCVEGFYREAAHIFQKVGGVNAGTGTVL